MDTTFSALVHIDRKLVILVIVILIVVILIILAFNILGSRLKGHPSTVSWFLHLCVLVERIFY